LYLVSGYFQVLAIPVLNKQMLNSSKLNTKIALNAITVNVTLQQNLLDADVYTVYQIPETFTVINININTTQN